MNDDMNDMNVVMNDMNRNMNDMIRHELTNNKNDSKMTAEGTVGAPTCFFSTW
jgi:hypothetical protein